MPNAAGPAVDAELVEPCEGGIECRFGPWAVLDPVSGVVTAMDSANRQAENIRMIQKHLLEVQ